MTGKRQTYRLYALVLFAAACVAMTLTYGAVPARAQLEDPAEKETSEPVPLPQEVTTSLAPAQKNKPAVETSETKDSGPPPKTPEEALQELTAELAHCALESDRMLRTRCYDDLSVEMGLMDDKSRMTEREKLETFGYWQVTSEKDMLGVETIYLALTPMNKLMAPTLQSKSPTFNIRCRQGQTDAYLDWKSPLNAQRLIMKDIFIYYKIDNMPDYRETWPLSLDGYAAFSPRPIDFVKSMKNKKKLLIRITPYGGTMEALAFDLTGFEKGLDVLVKRCY